LSTLGLYLIIYNSLRKDEKSSTEKSAIDVVEMKKITKLIGGSSSIVDDFNEKDYLCHGRIFSALSKEIYNIFCTTKTVIELWNALEKKYGTRDVGLKRFRTEKF